MKKFLALILILNYAVASFGVSLVKHYCGNKLVSTSITLPNTCVHDCNSNSSCCRDIHIYKKVELDAIQINSSFNFIIKHFNNFSHVVNNIFSLDFLSFFTNSNFARDKINIPLHTYSIIIFICSYLI